MAIYHFSGSVIARSQGRSVVAAAAYRAGEELIDERYEKTHDYTRKQEVAHCEILLPENAPAWMGNREALWNAVERIEKRKDAQLAREFTLSLPKEFTLQQNIALAHDFVQRESVDKGMVADICIHQDKSVDGELQPHAHVLLTLRDVSENGFGQKVRAWNDKALLLSWRQAWAERVNIELAKQGFDQRIDHRSYQDQGIALEPQHKIGASVAKERLARLADHQRIAFENGQRLLRDPAIALNALTYQQSTFTHHDLARFIHRHTGDAEQFQQVYDTVRAHPALVSLGHDAKGRERMTTQAMLEIETRLLQHAKALCTKNRHGVEGLALGQALRQRHLSVEQEGALRYLTDSGDLKCVVGYAGTGKSYLLAAAREAWESTGYHVKGVALSGIAAQNLMASSGIDSRTVASLSYRWGQGQDVLTARDILVIDEAGMLGSRQLEQLMTEAHTQGAKVVLVGDPQQLQAIEAGGAFRAVLESNGYLELTDIRRQEEPWQREATLELAKGDVAAALARYAAHDNIHVFTTQLEAKARLIDQWQDARHTYPEETQLILAYTRRDVKELNDLARELRYRDGELGEAITVMTEKGEREFALGDRVYFLRRDDQLRVVNGTLGTITGLEAQTQQLHITLDREDIAPQERQVQVDTAQYRDIEHGYAATVYKAQGVTVDRTYQLTSTHYDAHSTYVGLSRHRKSCDIFVSREAFVDDKALVNTLSRDRAKDITLDYTQPEREFARQRAIQPPAKEAALAVNILTSQAIDQLLRPVDMQLEKALQQSLGRDAAFKELASQFEQAFRQEDPGLAEALEKASRSSHAQKAHDYTERFEAYHQALQQEDVTQKEQRQFEQYTAEIAKQPQVMAHLKHESPELARQVEQLAKDHEKRLQRALERSRGIDISL